MLLLGSMMIRLWDSRAVRACFLQPYTVTRRQSLSQAGISVPRACREAWSCVPPWYLLFWGACMNFISYISLMLVPSLFLHLLSAHLGQHQCNANVSFPGKFCRSLHHKGSPLSAAFIVQMKRSLHTVNLYSAPLTHIFLLWRVSGMSLSSLCSFNTFP